MISLQTILEKAIASFSNTIKINVKVDKTIHAGERQSRHSDREISEGEIIETIQIATEKILKLMVFDKVDIGDAVHIHNTKTNLNVIGALENKTNNFVDFFVVTVMVKPNFKPKPGTKTIRV